MGENQKENTVSNLRALIFFGRVFGRVCGRGRFGYVLSFCGLGALLRTKCCARKAIHGLMDVFSRLESCERLLLLSTVRLVGVNTRAPELQAFFERATAQGRARALPFAEAARNRILDKARRFHVSVLALQLENQALVNLGTSPNEF